MLYREKYTILLNGTKQTVHDFHHPENYEEAVLFFKMFDDSVIEDNIDRIVNFDIHFKVHFYFWMFF